METEIPDEKSLSSGSTTATSCADRSSSSSCAASLISDDSSSIINSAIPSLRFPQKLWRIVNECRTGAISWGPNGLTLLVDYKAFQREYLDNEDSPVFKTSNMTSFVRQLNLYGFRKVTNHNRDLVFSSAPVQASGEQQQPDVHEFLHEHFRFGRLDLLSRVCRKTGVKKSLQAQLAKEKEEKVKQEVAEEAEDARSRLNGLTRLQMCQIALTKALEQATRQYRKEKFFLQLSKENIPKDALKPKYKTEPAEQDIQIIFQDLAQMEDTETLPMIDTSTIENVIGYQEKIKWDEVFTLPVENSVSISVPY